MPTVRTVPLRLIAAILFLPWLGCGEPQHLGAVKASIEEIDGQEQCVLEAEDMTLRQVVDAVEPFVEKKISFGPDAKPDQHIAEVRVVGPDWKTVLDRLAVHAGNMSVTETDEGITMALQAGNTSTASNQANQPMQPTVETH